MTQHFQRTPRAPFRGTRPYQLQWGSTAISLALTTGGTGGQQSQDIGAAVETALARSLANATVMRIRGRLMLVNGAAPLAGQNNVQLGVGWFVSDIDNADFPSLAAGDGSWIVYETFPIASAGALTTGNEAGLIGGYVIDSKAMRKANQNAKSLFAVGQMSGGGDVTISGILRVLIKMP